MRQFSYLLAWLARTILWALIVLGMQTAFAANMGCGVASSMTSPFPGNRVLDSGTQFGRTFFNGNLVVTLTACANTSSSADAFTVTIPVGNTGAALPAASGIFIQSTALPNYTIASVTGDPCTFVSSANSGASTSVTFNHPASATCNYTVTVPLSLKMISTSNIAASGISALSSSDPWWASYSSSVSGTLGSFPSSFDLISTACTLTTQFATVTLPTLSTAALNGGLGSTAGRTPFTVALSGCSDAGASYAAKVTWDYSEGPVPASIANSADVALAAGNVYVQLLDSALVPIGNGGISKVAQVTGGVASPSPHFAQYYAGAGTVVPGKVTGVTTLNLSYE